MYKKPPYYDEKRDLVENHTYTCDDTPCLVTGYAMDVACVTLLKDHNEHYHTNWTTIQTAVKDDGKITQNELWPTNQQCGCGASVTVYAWGQYLCDACLLAFNQSVQPIHA